ncbi:unnamed protein product [Schistosoma margrebowiei]|uniref:Uncharacterized protein n=2 Tax=Schistosoma TaxID=6181 RepID=A0A183MK26_9TREM|nr:unnamed protein product [Schistosoma margrebowiei]
MSIILYHLLNIQTSISSFYTFVLILLLICNTIQQLNEFNHQNLPKKYAIITTGGSHKSYITQKLNNDLYNTDYSRKINVKVSDILTRQAEAIASSQLLLSSSSSNNNKNIEYKINKKSNLSNQSNLLIDSNQRAQIIVKPSKNNINKNSLILPSNILQHSIINDDRSWPPEHSHEFEKVDIRVLGERIDSKALLHLRPSSTIESIRKLRRILGSDLQINWMSIENPLNSQSKSTRSTLLSNIPKPDNYLLNIIDELNFTVFRSINNDGLIYPLKMTIDQVNIMKTWLLQRATCTMEYIWEDLGPLFWPRWIKRGVCVNTQSCSWPPGMRCRSSGSRSLKLLRWVSENKYNYNIVQIYK